MKIKSFCLLFLIAIVSSNIYTTVMAEIIDDYTMDAYWIMEAKKREKEQKEKEQKEKEERQKEQKEKEKKSENSKKK